MQDEKKDKNCFSINKKTDILMNNECDIPLVDEGVEDIIEKSELENFINDKKNFYIKENLKDDTDKVSILQNDEKVLKESVDSEKIINNFEKLKLNQEESIESISSLNDIDTLPLDLNQFDTELNSDEKEEKERLIQQLIELRSTLDDLSHRVSSVKEETFKLANENNVLNQYVENLMSASSVFQSTATTNANAKRKQRKT